MDVSNVYIAGIARLMNWKVFVVNIYFIQFLDKTKRIGIILEHIIVIITTMIIIIWMGFRSAPVESQPLRKVVCPIMSFGPFPVCPVTLP